MSLSLPRLARRRLHHHRGLAAALCAGLAAALGLSGATLAVRAVTAETGLRSTLDGLVDHGLVYIQSSDPSDAAAYTAFEDGADQRVGSALGARVRPVNRFAALGSMVYWTVNGTRFAAVPREDDPNPPRPTFAYSEGLASHVRLIAGALPADAASNGDLPISLPETSPFGLRLGDRVCLGYYGGPNDPRRLGAFPLCLRVAASWRPIDRNDLYWRNQSLDQELFGSVQDVFAGLATYNRAFGTIAVLVTTARLYQVSLGAIDTASAPSVAQAVHSLNGHYTVNADSFFSSQVGGAIDGFEQRQGLGAYPIELVAAALVLLALSAVAFTARRFLEGQAVDLVSLRARGWPRRRAWALLALQLVPLVAVALPLGIVLAAGLTFVVARLSPLAPVAPDGGDLAGIAVPMAVTLGIALGLLAVLAAVAVRIDLSEARRGASRPAGLAWWRWRWAEVLAVVVALGLLAETQVRGSGQVRAAGAADDPVGLLLPSLAIGLLAAAGLRLLPVLSRLSLLVRGVPGSLARWQLARRPAQHAALALLMTAAVGIGVFSSIYAATDRANAVDRASYQAGADVRATFGQPVPPLDTLSGPSAGVAATSTALRTTASPGRADVQSTVLAIDTATFPDVAWSRPQLTSPSLGDLARLLAARSPDGLALPGRPRTLSMWAAYSGTGGRLAAEVTDAGGHSATLDLGQPAGGGWRQLQAPIRFPGEAAPAYPVRVVDLVFSGAAHGRLALSDLAADGRTAEAFTADEAWWTTDSYSQDSRSGATPTMDVPRNGQPALALDVSQPGGRLTLGPPTPDQPVPALASSALLGALSIGLNQPFPLHFDAGTVQVVAVAAVDSFPTLYPNDQFLVLPLTGALAHLSGGGAISTPANELWLRLSGSGAAAQAQAQARRLSAAGLARDVEIGPGLRSASLTDPLRTALDGTLAVGVVATLAVAVLAYGLHFLAVARSRMGEYAILRANGLGPSQVARSLLVEQAVVLAHGVVVGTALGLLVAYALLPALQLGVSAMDVLPPTVVTLDWLSMGVAVGALVVGALLAGWLARRQVARLDVRDRLRLLS